MKEQVPLSVLIEKTPKRVQYYIQKLVADIKYYKELSRPVSSQSSRVYIDHLGEDTETYLAENSRITFVIGGKKIAVLVKGGDFDQLVISGEGQIVIRSQFMNTITVCIEPI